MYQGESCSCCELTCCFASSLPVANPPLPPPRQTHSSPVVQSTGVLLLPGSPSAASILAPHTHVNLELPTMASFLPSSSHNAGIGEDGRYQNPNGPTQYTLATRLEQARRHRQHRSSRPREREREYSPPPAGAPSRGEMRSSYLPNETIKTLDTDLTRYKNTSSFRGTTPPQRLRYIFTPSEDVPKDYLATQAMEPSRLVSDGRFRTWMEVPYDATHKPQAYRDHNGVEWVPVLSKDATPREMRAWESRERRRVGALEAREREYMARHHGRHSSEWEEAEASIHPAFVRDLSLRNRDGSSKLITPDGSRSMTLLDARKPWHEREYHHVGRDPHANYATIFGGLEAEAERQRVWREDEHAAEEARLKHQRKVERDREHARRKEEKMMLKYDLELQRLAAKKQRAQAAAEQAAGVVKKKIVRGRDGKEEVVFVKEPIASSATQRQRPGTAKATTHAPWGASAAAQRNVARPGTADRRGRTGPLSPSMTKGTTAVRARSAARTGQSGVGASWMRGMVHSRSRSRSRSHSRSRSRSTSSQRRRRARRAEKEARAATKAEARRKKEHALRHSTAVQAGDGTMPDAARHHPRASDLEAYLLQQAKERRGMSLERLNSTLNSLDNLTIGGVGRTRDHERDRRAPRSDSSSERSHSSDSSSSGFSSRSSSASRSSSRRHRHRHHRRHHSRSRSRSLSPSPASDPRYSRPYRSRSRSSTSSSSRSRSRSSSSSSSSSRRRRRSSKKHKKSRDAGSDPQPSQSRDWTRRGSFEEMDARIRERTEAKWLKAWEKRYAKASSEREKRALKEEKKEWKARRATQHTLLQASHATSATDAYLQSPNAATALASPSPAVASVTGASASPASSVLTDQYGTPIAQYGTVYPKPQGTLLEQASTLEAYAASLAYTDHLLAETRNAMEASVAGIENIVDGVRNGYATKGVNAQAEAAQQKALQLSLRAAIRAREDRRKKTEAMNRANRDVLDELRRQEAVIMDRAKETEEQTAAQAYEAAARVQQAKLMRQQQAAEAAMLAQQQQQEMLHSMQYHQNGGGRPRTASRPRSATSHAPIDGRRPRASPNAGLGGPIAGVSPYWYEDASPSFTTNMMRYNDGLKSHLNAAGVRY